MGKKKKQNTKQTNKKLKKKKKISIWISGFQFCSILNIIQVQL